MSIVSIEEVRNFLPEIEMSDGVIQGLIYKAKTYMESQNGADRILTLEDRVDEFRVVNSIVQITHFPINEIYRIRGIKQMYNDPWGRNHNGIFYNYTHLPRFTTLNTAITYEDLDEDMYYIDGFNKKLVIKPIFARVEVSYQTGWDFTETNFSLMSDDVKTLKLICLNLVEILAKTSQLVGIKKDDLLGITYNDISVNNEISRIMEPLYRFRPQVYYYV